MELTQEQFEKEIGYDLQNVTNKNIIDAIFNWANTKVSPFEPLGYMVKADEVTLDLIMHHTVKQCQNILAKWIVPDSGISDKDCLTELLGVLDNQHLVRYMRFIEANLKDKDGKPLSI